MSDSEKKRKMPFIPARPDGLLIRAAQEVVRSELAWKNKLHVDKKDLDILKHLPRRSGAILTPNHADETDPLISLELSRRSGKRFILMCNREAFSEFFGFAGWALQRLGHFSVERGAHDLQAKQYAIDVVKKGREVLVIFPEGEIYYLNEEIQPFHSGAVDIAMKAIVERRKRDEKYSAFIVPMAVKYHYRGDITRILQDRVLRMERELSLKSGDLTLSKRLHAIQAALLHRQEKAYHLEFDQAVQNDLLDEIRATEKALLSEVEGRHKDLEIATARPIDQSWQLSAEIRDGLANQLDSDQRRALEEDLEELKEVAHLSSWQPHYYEGDASNDRLAEVVLKLERELFNIKRPQQLAARDVFVKLSDPIDLGRYVVDYQQDAHNVRQTVTSDLHERIQGLVDKLAAHAALSK